MVPASERGSSPSSGTERACGMNRRRILIVTLLAWSAGPLAVVDAIAGPLDLLYGWTNSVGGGPSNKDGAVSVATDPSGSVFVLGVYVGPVDFDPGPGQDLKPHGSPGNSNIFLSKYAADGSYLWTQVWTWDTYCNVFGVVVDLEGSVLLTGGFWLTQDFDPGPGEDWHTASALGEFLNSDIFVIKLANDGDFLWARTMGNDEFCHGLGLAVDSAGDVYVTGQFEGVVDFDPGWRRLKEVGSAVAVEHFVRAVEEVREGPAVVAVANRAVARGTGESAGDASQLAA